ncbi:MAG: DNA mismatch repair protein MutS [Pseudomonadota bacterium]
MMAQFLEIKARYPMALLFYRMGDFYELFFEDAEAAAAALDITLTKRGKHEGADIPMCGVPVHAAEGYLLTLIRKGFRVAVCEQLENPAEAKKRGSKSVVKRGVVRLVTPGTLTEDTLLDARSNNYLAALNIIRGDAALAWADLSTGEVTTKALKGAQIAHELARLSPSELLVPDGLDIIDEIETPGTAITERPRSAFDSTSAQDRIGATFAVQSSDAFGQFDRVEQSALGALIEYFEITQIGRAPLLQTPRREAPDGAVAIDAATRRNLELTETLSGQREGSLLWAIDRTVTPGGGRLLKQRLSTPIRDIERISARSDAVGYFADDHHVADAVRAQLKRCPDIDRPLARIGLERAQPRDLGAIRDALLGVEVLFAELPKAPGLLQLDAADREKAAALGAHLTSILADELPVLVSDGGFVRSGFDAALDEARALRDESRKVIASLQSGFIAQTGINALKIKHNAVLGYFIEVPSRHAEAMLSEPLSDTFRHRQTTANALRFTTIELAELEQKILRAADEALSRERAHFKDMVDACQNEAARLSVLARWIAEIDVASAMGTLSRQENWTRPVLSGDNRFEIQGGRHPVVEQSLKTSGEPFIANDCMLSDGNPGAKIRLLTGPNMAGKSTYLRQNAIIALLAQAGFFVPAQAAKIGLVSQIFSRVGASDDLARGRSTFMVEMVETAAILNQADDRALVILDEIGRGTATYDGLSIAWATLEHLHAANACRALFATHYHELTPLAEKLSGVENATMAVKEWEGEVVFLHEVRPGAADRSYGVQVARLAGLPSSVIERAKMILTELETSPERTKDAAILADALPLFAVKQPEPVKVPEALLALDKLDPDTMTPREALDALYALKTAAEKS